MIIQLDSSQSTENLQAFSDVRFSGLFSYLTLKWKCLVTELFFGQKV